MLPVQYVIKRPFFTFFKTHHCPKCGEKMNRRKVSKILEERSLEYKQFGKENNVWQESRRAMYIWYIFECPICGCQRSIQEMYEHEKRNASMNLSKLKVELKKLDIPEEAYHLDGGLPNECYCIGRYNGNWEV